MSTATSTRATAKFELKGWDEQTLEEIERGRKLTRASVKNTWTGDVEGDGTLEYLMAYRDDGTADFVGLHRVVGRAGGRSGSFVLRDSGTYGGGAARGNLTVVPGAGTGELSGLRGEGSYISKQGEHHADITLEVHFE